MACAQVLLLENIHLSANDAFEEHKVAIHRRSGSLCESELLKTVEALKKDLPCMLGIRSKTQLNANFITSIPNLIAIGAFCIGTDQIDLDAAGARGIPVFNAPFSNTRSVAELVLGELIMLSRKISVRNDEVHRGIWEKTAVGSHEIRGKTLGIVGYGHIGSQLSVLAESMGLRVLYFDILSKLPLGNATSCATLPELIASSHFISLHVPDTQVTRNLIGYHELAAMQSGSYLINASRGQVVDLEALRQHIQNGHIAGAAIDVFPTEPTHSSQPFKCILQELPNVILTPHIGGSTEEAQASIGREVSQYLCGFLRYGTTTGNHTLPELDIAPLRTGCRLIHVHQNVPGVLSAVNGLIADAKLNVEAQHLGTKNNLGLLSVDLAVSNTESKVIQLRRKVSELPSSIRTVLLANHS